jgi:hypothetical protein
MIGLYESNCCQWKSEKKLEYRYIIAKSSKKLNGTSEILLSMDTYQFSDYSKYEASKFNEKHKAQVKAKQFPMDCQKAFDVGARLAVT